MKQDCKTIEDFGRVAFKLRFIDKKAAWNDIYEKTKDFDVIGYVKEHYIDYVEQNKNEIIGAIMENTVEPEKRDEMRETMRGWLDEAIRMVKNGEELYWMPERIFYDSVAVAMKKIGVK
ncbi:hypothetical protein Calhy_2538 [Caldicellulosiruptor hydrothermalis 108]|uniref:Uncharacterized protein n=1 Tax=Caldicellulosiruptor hydrothermalis (strain DSM 18901 / VKM B-2411 / 108) TaxID=632292 RepID=E4QAC5_CALH1|nr:hypothetical protein [Caldicellulosiruptor hydrothermalis]ADQ08229.1 hypothetical protein Calhy_2538 [Caldicellulosiruptor hydrothermalis 108]